MIFYSGPLSMFSAKAEIAMIEKGLDYERVFVPFSIATLYAPKHPEVARINPKGQVPVLVDDDTELFDSTQIFEYLEEAAPEPPLWPRERGARAKARLIELKSDEVFFPNVVQLMPAQLAGAEPAAVEAAGRSIQSFYAYVDEALSDAEYLVGEFSYADIAFFMAQYFAQVMGQPYGAELRTLDAWRSRVAARPSVQQVAGEMGRYLAAQGVDPPPL